MRYAKSLIAIIATAAALVMGALGAETAAAKGLATGSLQAKAARLRARLHGRMRPSRDLRLCEVDLRRQSAEAPDDEAAPQPAEAPGGMATQVVGCRVENPLRRKQHASIRLCDRGRCRRGDRRTIARGRARSPGPDCREAIRQVVSCRRRQASEVQRWVAGRVPCSQPCAMRSIRTPRPGPTPPLGVSAMDLPRAQPADEGAVQRAEAPAMVAAQVRHRIAVR
jgi:hypothetical protein